MMFLDCPASLDAERIVRCGLPAEVRGRFIMHSTDGPLESAMIKCPAGHWFTGPIESLTWETRNNHHPGATGAGSSARHGKPQGTHDGDAKRGGSAVQDSPTKPEQKNRRPNGAPGYYLSRPAELWITAMRPRRGRTAPHHLMEAATGGPERTPSPYGDPLTGAQAGTASLPAARARLAPEQVPRERKRSSW
jgi:hypothetical protein